MATAPGHVAAVRRLVFDPLTKAQHRQLRDIGRRVVRAIDPDGFCLKDEPRDLLFDPAVPAGAYDEFLVEALPRARAQRAWTPADGPLPALYLSHGAPPLFDDGPWLRQLFDWAQSLPKPRSILIVSAHWESAPLALSAAAAHTPLGLRLRRLPPALLHVTIRRPTPRRWPVRWPPPCPPANPCTGTPAAGSTMAPGYRSWRCTRWPTSPSCSCPCRPTTRPVCSTSAPGCARSGPGGRARHRFRAS